MAPLSKFGFEKWFNLADWNFGRGTEGGRKGVEGD